jgi:hypothetical protein
MRAAQVVAAAAPALQDPADAADQPRGERLGKPGQREDQDDAQRVRRRLIELAQVGD